MIALNVSALIRHGGTLQVGIGELGDGIVARRNLGTGGRQSIEKYLHPPVFLIARRLTESGGGRHRSKRLYGMHRDAGRWVFDLYRSGIFNGGLSERAGRSAR
jgi:hypothetical protein